MGQYFNLIKQQLVKIHGILLCMPIKPTCIFLYLLSILLIMGCNKYRLGFLHEKDKLIAIQPLGDFDSLQAALLGKEIAAFYHKEVMVLSPVKIPPTCMTIPSYGLYAADSILKFLSSTIDNRIIEVVGLTHVDIYTAEEQAVKEENQPAPIKIILGLSQIPGNVCVVSDYGLRDPDSQKLQRRIKTVMLHEMGHNLGLTHCEAPTCIMSDDNGKREILDRSKNYYCDKCKRKMKQKAM